MRDVFRPLLLGLFLLKAGWALEARGGKDVYASGALPANYPRLANHAPFVVPLASGQVGTALCLPGPDAQWLIVASPRSSPSPSVDSAPVLTIYRLEPYEAPEPEPGPKPEPKPEPGPGPKPEPQPVPKGPLRLLWIEESANRTAEQAQAITDAAIRRALAQAGWSLRVADVDVVDEQGRPPEDLRPYIDAARQAGLPRLFALTKSGTEIYNGKAPSTAAEFRELLGRLGLGMHGDAGPAPAEAKTPPQPFTQTQVPEPDSIQEGTQGYASPRVAPAAQPAGRSSTTVPPRQAAEPGEQPACPGASCPTYWPRRGLFRYH